MEINNQKKKNHKEIAFGAIIVLFGLLAGICCFAMFVAMHRH